MARFLAILAFALAPVAAFAQTIDFANVYATGGKSNTNRHGQADMQSINFEIGKSFSPRTELSFVAAAMSIYQPVSWFGNEFGDGSESAYAVSGSLLARRRFHLDSDRWESYVELSSGPMWANKRVPAETSRFNFISQFGAGFVLMPRREFPVIVGYRLAHISNAGYAPRNPGLNVSSIVIGTRFGR